MNSSRHKLILFILLAYLLPVFGLSFLHADATRSWPLLGFGLLVASAGSFLFLWRLQSLEQNIPPSPPEVSVQHDFSEWEEKLRDQERQALELQKSLQEQLELKNREIAEIYSQQEQREKTAEEQQADLQKEFAEQRQNLLDEMDKQRQLLVDHYQTILEQRDVLDRKTQQMTQLESKVRDLNYELKTILQLTEKTIPIQEIPLAKPILKAKQESLVDSVVPSEEDATLQLKRCLEIAQSMTGASHYAGNSRFREFSAGHFALDQRRLFDRLRTEEDSTIFVYSPKDSRMLFVNDQVKLLLGVTTDRFVQGFYEIVAPGRSSWENALQQLTFRNEVQIQIPFKSRFGEEILVECVLGIIPTGIFRDQIIGILFLATHLQELSKSI